MDARHVIFRGRVQGVGFRFTSQRIARRYGLSGWVRNLPDGTVEMFIQGDEGDIQDCLNDIEEAFRGYITETEIEKAAPEPKYEDFKITY